MDTLRVLLFSFLLLVRLVLAVGKCPPLIDCGSVGNITFPFTITERPECGIFEIHGCDDYEPEAKKTIQNNKRWFDIIKIDGLTITIRDDKLHDMLLQKSCEILTYHSIFTVSTPLASSHLLNYVTVFGCSINNTLDLQHYYSVSNSTAICRNDAVYVTAAHINKTQAIVAVSDPMILSNSKSNHLKGCSMVQLPTRFPVDHIDPADLFTFLTADIAIQIQLSPDCSSCHDTYGGQCRLDNSAKFYCDQAT